MNCCNQACRQGRDCPRRQTIHLQNALGVIVCAAMLVTPVIVYVIRTGGCY